MKLSEINCTQYPNIQILLSRKCNQNCDYCDIWNKTDNSEVDLNYLKEILEKIDHDKFAITLSGGEIGIIPNLIEIFDLIYSFNKRIKIMSNGAVRINYPELLPKCELYHEHLIKTANENKLIKFYDLDYVKGENTRNIVVLDESLVDYLLRNPKEIIRMNQVNTLFKQLESKVYSNKTFRNKTSEVMKLAGNDKLLKIKSEKILNKYRKWCWENTPQIYVDIEGKRIGRCAVHSMKEDNFDHCKDCYSMPYSSIEKAIRNILNGNKIRK